MTVRQFVHARNPGPTGLLPGAAPQLPPGPLGIRLGVFAAPQQLAKVLKTFKMPAPAGDNKTKLVRDVTWDLFKKEPAMGDVQQGELRNCPLASLLAALANIPSGRAHIKSLVAEHSAVVDTDVSGVANDLDSAPPGNKIQTNRYFTVQLGGGSYDISSVLYTDDADRNWSLIYMRSPNDALWPCIIEKAYANKEGSYGELDSAFGKGITLNEIWETVTGSKPQGFAVDDKTKDSVISATAKDANRVPTVAASKLKLVMSSGATRWHGFVVLGMKGSQIELYDAAALKRQTFSLKEFRDDFSAILYGTP